MKRDITVGTISFHLGLQQVKHALYLISFKPFFAGWI